MRESTSLVIQTDYSELTDQDILAAVRRAVNRERCSIVHVIALLAELDSRGLYLGEGCSSIFTYCVQVLRLSEYAAYGRIAAARAALRFPAIFKLLAEGEITLTTITILSRHLTLENHLALLTAARFKSRRDVERQVAALHPRPDVAFTLYKVPQRRAGAPINAGSVDAVQNMPAGSGPPLPFRQRTIIAPLAPHRYYLRVTVSGQTRVKLQRAQDLLRHALPNGDAAEVLDRALTLLISQLERTKHAATDRPRRTTSPVVVAQTSRHIPAAVRRTVWARDGGRCAFTGSKGRCTETGLLEFHHVMPFANGGPSTVENLQLRCRSHNAFEADRDFGKARSRNSVRTESTGESSPAPQLGVERKRRSPEATTG